MKLLISLVIITKICIAATFLGVFNVQAQGNDLLFPNPPGIESYTFRSEFSKNVPATLDMIKQLGITDIEFSSLFNLQPETLRQMLDKRKLTCSSYGNGWDNIINHTEDVAKVAMALGVRYIHLGSIPHKGSIFTIDDAKNAVIEFNRVGKIFKENYGLELLYHNHGVEFVPYGNGTLYDYLVKNTNPSYVSFELDIMWAFLPGVDPAKLISTYPSRFKALHLKDLKKGVAINASGHTDHNNNVVLGAGQIDISAVLKAAIRAGIKHYYLEDESKAAVQQLPLSIRYLGSLKK